MTNPSFLRQHIQNHTCLYNVFFLTRLLLNTTCAVLPNSADPDQKKPTDLDLHCLSLNMLISSKNPD